MNRIYRNDPDFAPRARASLRAGAAQDSARVAELGRQLARALESESPGRAQELARLGREAARLPPQLLERLLASVPGAAAEAVREALRSPVRPAGALRPAPTDSLERAPDPGPFAGHTTSVRVTAVEPEAVAVSPLEAEDLSRSRAWRDPVDGDRAPVSTPAASAPTPRPETRAGEPADVSVEPAEAAAASPAEPVGPASEPAPTAPVYVGEKPVAAAWLEEREATLVAIRADYEAARARALATPGEGPGWQAGFPQYDGESGSISSANRAVWVPDPNNPQEISGWSEGEPIYRAVGRWVEFSEESFAAHYRGAGGEPLQRLAAVYDPTGGKDIAALLAAHPELWGIAISDHALNAGPPPPGFAMGAAGQLGMLDLYLADPQMAALIEAYGGDPAPAASGMAAEQVRLFGERRFEQMNRLASAMASVRSQYTDALIQAQQAGSGPGWVERELTRYVTVDAGEGSATGVEPAYVRDGNGNIVYDASGQPVVAKERAFDPDAFTDWYLAQGGVQHQAFASLYGRSHTQYATTEGESGPATFSVTTTFDNPNWRMYGGGVMEHADLRSLDPNHPPRLRDDRVVGFDFEAGWATPHGNIYRRRNWVETAFQVAFVAAVCYVSAGTLGYAAGSAASSAAAGAGASAATAGAVGAAASAAAVGAAASVANGMISGNLTLKNVLQGALAGALTAGVMNSALAETVHAAAGTAGTLALQTTVRGAIQALLDGSFQEGARLALAGGLADLLGADLNTSINRAVAAGTMSASEAIAARTFARMFGSAIRAAGNPDDPGYAFASDFLSETVRSVLPPLPAPVSPVNQATPEAAATAPAASDDGFHAISDRDDLRAVVSGFGEGASFPVADDSQAMLLIRGVLQASPSETGLGEEDLSRLRAQLQQAWNDQDMRALGQLLGQVATAIARTEGGVDGLARRGEGSDSLTRPALYRPGTDDGWFQSTAGGAAASGRGTAAPGRSDQPRTQTFDDGSRLYDLGDGRFAAIPATEHQRAFAIERFSQRALESTGRPPYEAAERVAEVSRMLGPTGDTILAEALATGRMSVGLAGITVSGGGRSPQVLEEFRVEVGRLIGRDVPAVLDNSNGPLDALVSAPNPQQQTNLDRLLWLARDAGIRTDVAVHSNGVNALAASLRDNPSFRLGEVRLIDVNVNGDLRQATEDLRRIVGASTRTTLVTTAADLSLGLSAAGSPIRTLIPAAAAAGVEYIRVLPGVEHGVDAVRAALEQQGPEGPFDFRRNDSGQVVPLNEAAWREVGYTWSNGRLQYNPWPAPRRGTPARRARGGEA